MFPNLDFRLYSSLIPPHFSLILHKEIIAIQLLKIVRATKLSFKFCPVIQSLTDPIYPRPPTTYNNSNLSTYPYCYIYNNPNLSTYPYCYIYNNPNLSTYPYCYIYNNPNLSTYPYCYIYNNPNLSTYPYCYIYNNPNLSTYPVLLHL